MALRLIVRCQMSDVRCQMPVGGSRGRREAWLFDGESNQPPPPAATVIVVDIPNS
jgi:hypothetical protein